MITPLIWLGIVIGAVASVIQMFTARRLQLRPLILGSLAIVALLGLLALFWHGAQGLDALGLAPSSERAVRVSKAFSTGVNELLWSGIGILLISGLGGIGMLVRDLADRRRAAAGSGGGRPGAG